MALEKTFKGTGVALVTPFHEDGSVDYKGLSNLIRHVVEGGVSYLVVLGTTAESATLDAVEQERIRRFVVSENAGRLPLVLGLGGNDTRKLVTALQNQNFSGYDAILSVTPYYNRPSQEGLYRHYSTLAEHTPLPIILYNVPARTGVNMLPETVNRLAQSHCNILGIKEAVGDMQQVKSLLALVPEHFLVISGDDASAAETAYYGGAGVISVLGQALPGLVNEMMRYALSGARVESQILLSELTNAMDLIFQEGNPAGIKAMLELLGICGKQVRLPLVQASDALSMHLAEALGKINKHPQLRSLNLG
ncbi:MAG: hypothetical protein RLZZ241_2433 [Bacteroidota bacterium]|jgi:4-hydroxy-tetrahydrodipicolinate synthase